MLLLMERVSDREMAGGRERGREREGGREGGRESQCEVCKVCLRV